MLFNNMLEKLYFAGVIKLLDEGMILPVTIIGLLCTSLYWRTFSIVWFFFQSVDNKQYTSGGLRLGGGCAKNLGDPFLRSTQKSSGPFHAKMFC